MAATKKQLMLTPEEIEKAREATVRAVQENRRKANEKVRKAHEREAKALADLKHLKSAVREVGLDILFHLDVHEDGKSTAKEALARIREANARLDHLTD